MYQINISLSGISVTDFKLRLPIQSVNVNVHRRMTYHFIGKFFKHFVSIGKAPRHLLVTAPHYSLPQMSLLTY